MQLDANVIIQCHSIVKAFPLSKNSKIFGTYAYIVRSLWVYTPSTDIRGLWTSNPHSRSQVFERTKKSSGPTEKREEPEDNEEHTKKDPSAIDISTSPYIYPVSDFSPSRYPVVIRGNIRDMHQIGRAEDSLHLMIDLQGTGMSMETIVQRQDHHRVY